jgi:hypothetical protein
MVDSNTFTDALLVVFCLRLPFGLIASLLVLNPDPIPPRFFRVQFVVALVLLAVAFYFVSGAPVLKLNITWSQWLLNTLLVSAVFCFVGGIVWHLDSAPFGRVLIWLTTIALTAVLFFVTRLLGPVTLDWWRLTDHYASAAMLGTATSAMLLGHSYLISPAMTISPLKRMLAAATVALTIRIILALCGLWFWTAEHPLANLDVETLLWLSARWLLGILAPLALGWMAWETARIRSTQSATGILYVVVIVCFLGELTSLLLLEKTGSVL